MHHPEVLILDEPTNGLDPLIQKTFHEIMLEQKAAGRTVFLSSHILSEVQAICERVGILRDGELKAVERVADLTRVNFNHVTITFNAPVSLGTLAGIPGVSDVSADGMSLQFKLSGDLDPVLRALNDRYIVRIHAADPTLEEIFLTYYGNSSPVHETAQPNASKKASV
jgi:ABC-2 type transport system ATP-binding protein